MEATVESLEEQALALPVKDRLRLANTMLKSAPSPGQDLTEEEWGGGELKRRADEIDSGEVVCRKWDEIREEVNERFSQ